MKKLSLLVSLICLFAAANPAFAVVAAPVNIVYPLNGSTVANNFTGSFSANCPGGAQNAVAWFLDGAQIGKAFFYDMASVQFAYRLASGATHSLRVTTSCGGADGVAFKVQ